MTDLMQRIIESKRASRKELTALPVSEKLRILEQMIEATRAIAASRTPKPPNPVRLIQGLPPQRCADKARMAAGAPRDLK